MTGLVTRFPVQLMIRPARLAEHPVRILGFRPGLGADLSHVDAASSPDDPASGPDPGPGWVVEPATPKATRNRLVPGAGILAFADGLEANLPMMLRLVREFEEAGEQLPRSVTDVVATFRDCCVVLEEWPRHEGPGQVQDNLMSSGEDAGDSDHDSLFVTP